MVERDTEIIRLYSKEKMTLRMIAKRLNTDHHNIKRVLVKNNVEVSNTNRIRDALTVEHRAKIGESKKGNTWSRGRIMSRKHKLQNMASHIKYDVDIEFYNEFEDIEKLKCLNKMLTKDRVSIHFDTERYKEFIHKFYYDKQFNTIFNNWISNNKDKWWKPSLDHIYPSSKGGTYDLDNLQILTWFENKTKCSMTEAEWKELKLEINTKSNLFYSVA